MKTPFPGRSRILRAATALVVGLLNAVVASAQTDIATEFLAVEGAPGPPGGRLFVTQRGEPKTLNPVVAADNASRTIIRLLSADLLHINRETHRTGPALATSWEVSEDGRLYTLQLRRGVRFSDGQLFDADDVLFTFEVYLDEAIHSPSRDLLVVGGEPIRVRKLDANTVSFELAEPYGASERLFDSIAILPRHILEAAYRKGELAATWSLSSAPSTIVGLGPFRLKSFHPGERIVLERNPYYWKVDDQNRRLPCLDEIVFLTVPGEDAEVLRFQAGESHLLSRIGAGNYRLLSQKGRETDYVLKDLGAGLEYNFLFFNLNELGQEQEALARKQAWFSDVRFRQAVSLALDRRAMTDVVYQGLAEPLASHVTPGNKLWFNEAVHPPTLSTEKARRLLREADYQWDDSGRLVDSRGAPVEISLLTSAGNVQRSQLAAMIQADLREIGIEVRIVTLEFRAYLDRIFEARDYESCLIALGSGDVDPSSELSVWLSTGATHLWRLGQSGPRWAWEVEIDTLMTRQMSSTRIEERRRLYDRVQEIVARELPIVPLLSPHILVAARKDVGNFRPAILDDYVLWNAEQLFLRR